MGGALRKMRRELSSLLLIAFVLEFIAGGVLWITLNNFWEFDELELIIIFTTLLFVIAILLTIFVGRLFIMPIEMIVAALGHLEPGASVVGAPNLDMLTVGHSLTEEATKRIYEIAGGRMDVKNEPKGAPDRSLEAIFSLMPVSVIALDADGKIAHVNDKAKKYLGDNAPVLQGQQFSDIFNMNYSGSQRFEEWLIEAKAEKITSSRSWERVAFTTDEGKFFFDMAAYYSKDEPHGFETVIALIDHTDRYEADEGEMGFVSLAVHELRTPITVLRGYIEVFEEDMGEKMDKDLHGYVDKMSVAAAQLALFINNILNVSRIDNNQMNINRVEVDWRSFVEKTIMTDFAMRAKVYNRKISVALPEKVPTVAADPVSMYEVMSNLVDNAIKYSHNGGEIIIRVAVDEANQIVTTSIQDFGIGIPESVMGKLFEKFYRSHRSRQSVGGSGLGLYLSKTIIEAHEGNISVQSVEDQGSVFSFTLPTYESVASELDKDNNDGIERGSHGWIKNHSMHRR